MDQGIIILTDEFPWKNGAGIGQAMYNLFSGYQGKLWVLMAKNEPMPPIGEGLHAQALSYREPGPSPMSNRLGKWVNPTISRMQFNNRSVNCLPADMPTPLEAMVLVSTTSPAKLQVAWLLQQKAGYKVIPFFMDDWLAGNNISWKGGNIQQVATDILKQAPARIMISRQLAQILEKRYQPPPAPALIVQNPAPPPLRTHTDPPIRSLNPSTNKPNNLIIYAGSIWPMHADALIAVAKAVHWLNSAVDICYPLVLFTPERHWMQYRNLLEGPGVSWGGWMPQIEQLRQKLPDAWLLLCCASFKPQNSPMSAGSIQSKIFEYMAAGRPILYVGPKSGASGEFLEEWECGFTLYDETPGIISETLKDISSNDETWLVKAQTAIRLAKTTFSQQTVQNTFYDFLEKIKP